jgi:hypothetical protein
VLQKIGNLPELLQYLEIEEHFSVLGLEQIAETTTGSTIGVLTMSRCQLCAISQSATTGLVVSSVDLLRLGKPVRFGPAP